MRIGIDFDNTIVSYDTLFYKVALERGVIPAGLPQTKLAVRDCLRSQGQEDMWTEMQGYVYGARMDEAEAYPGVLKFLCWAHARNIAISIISHKTQHPFIGPKYDLHRAARLWIGQHLKDGLRPLVPTENIYFELDKEGKLRRIKTVGCDYYIDDLPEILLAEDFPVGPQRILFDPEAHHDEVAPLVRVRSWNNIRRHFQRECRTAH